MKIYLIKRISPFFKGAYFIVGLFIFLISCSGTKEGDEVRKMHTENEFQEVKDVYLADLESCISNLDSLASAESTEEYQKYYKLARKYFKYAEPIMAATDVNNYRTLNGPNILNVEEEDFTDIKIKEPSGFQVLEELIFTDTLDTVAIKHHAEFTRNRLKLISNNLYFQKHKPYHFLWLFRNEINRIALTGITGFDSPMLENSLEESVYAYTRLKDYLKIFGKKFENPALLEEWSREIYNSIESLSGDFNSFDRFSFIKNHTHRQLQLWVKTVEDWKVKFPFTLAINNDALTLFSANTFNREYFADQYNSETNQNKVVLGMMLFNDKRLSSSGKISCASCHQQDLAFSDGKKVAAGQERNSPTLTYAGLQQAWFYDSRAGSLEGQIVSVVKKDSEFHSNLNEMTNAVKSDSFYSEQFSRLYSDTVTDQNIRNAIATYIRDLAPFNSKFDRNINGQEQTLTESEIRGFNLFTGKAKCATCHFAPVFNGTVPPEFTETELEMLGVPSAAVTTNASIDTDPGRYNVFLAEARKFFFKTPTVRNIAKTAPYMHNGVYKTLDEVIEFYDLGGGAGIGIDHEHQTLPPEPLNLTDQEKQDLIEFLESLTDNEGVNNISF